MRLLNCTGSSTNLKGGGDERAVSEGRGGEGGGQVSGAALPVDRQMQPVDGVERVGQVRLQLQLGEEGEVVRGDVGVGAASDVVVHEPLTVQRSQQAQDAHVGLGEEDVVDHTLPTNAAC